MKTLKVNDDVWYAAKLQATKQKITLQTFVEKALWIQLGKTIRPKQTGRKQNE